MKINFVTIAPENLASYRYHIKTPAIQLHKLGHKVFISKNPIKDCDAYIFHKHLRIEEPEMMSQIKIHNPKSKNIFICCDYHLDNQHSNHYRRMINLCDELVVCTSHMSKILFDECGKDSTIIEDPWEVSINDSPANFMKKEVFNLLWFGSTTNLNSIISRINDIGDHNLTLVTNHKDGDYLINGKRVKIVDYSLATLAHQLEICDLVIIPQEINTKSKMVKSHNRLVDSIRAGKFVIASPIPSYIELRDYAYIGELKNGLDWISKINPNQIINKINEGKNYVNKRFSPDLIGMKWDRLICKQD